MQYLQSIVGYDYELSNETAAKIVHVYEDYLQELDAIEPPDLAKELHEYQLESIRLEKKKWEGIQENYMRYVFIDEALHEEILETIEQIKAQRSHIEDLFS